MRFNIKFKKILFIFFGIVFLHFWSCGHFSGPLVLYLFGSLDSVYGTSSGQSNSSFYKSRIKSVRNKIGNH